MPWIQADRFEHNDRVLFCCRGEIIELEWWRVNLKEGYLDLTPAHTKTNESRRVYFNAVKDVQDAFIQASKSRLSGQKIVFTKPGGNPILKWYIQRLFKKACYKADVKTLATQ